MTSSQGGKAANAAQPVPDGTNRVRITQWITDGGATTLTIVGILLYISLTVPATIYYGRLGTTPQEVGVTYASLLGGSILGVAVTIIILTLTLTGTVVVLAFASFSLRILVTFPYLLYWRKGIH